MTIMDLKSTYNKIAEDWHRDHEKDDWWQDGVDIFISFLKPGAKILDAGCGGGITSRYFIERGFILTGIDFSEKMIEISSRESPRGDFFVMDMRDLKKLTEQFDGICAKASLLHFEKKEIPKIIEEFLKKLKNGGFLYVAVKGGRVEQKDERVIAENDYGYDYQRFFSFYTLPEMVKYFTDGGLKLVSQKVSKLGNTDWIEIIGQKV